MEAGIRAQAALKLLRAAMAADDQQAADFLVDVISRDRLYFSYTSDDGDRITSMQKFVDELNSDSGGQQSPDESGFKIGDRVQVLPGMAHHEPATNVVGTVETISTSALGIRFDNTSEVFRWYVGGELQLVEDSETETAEFDNRPACQLTAEERYTRRVAGLAN